MKLLHAVIYGFGKFYQKSFSFQDGIHVIYGPNEAGKSTLHTFLGCMLFGLERGRGRAARGDLYSRCLPWDHDATYGGSLTFENDDCAYQIERNFRSDRRSCLLSRPGTMPTACSDNDLAERYYEGLTESLYYNTISVRSLGCAPDTSLAEELGRHLTGFQQAGTDTIDYHAAVSWLKAERKRQENQLDPSLEKQILQKKQSLEQLNQRLQNTTFQEKKAALAQEMDACLEQLAALTPSTGKGRHDRSDRDPSAGPVGEAISGTSPAPLLSWLLLLALAVIAGLLWTQAQPTWAAIVGVGALLMLLSLLLQGRKHRVAVLEDEETEEDEENDTGEEIGEAEDADTDIASDDMDGDPDDADIPADHADISRDTSSEDPRARCLRLHMQSLQKQYETVCRQEWDHDRLLEQAQSLEEDLEQLTIRAAEEESIRLEIQSISLALSTLQTLAGQMRDSIGPVLSHGISRILGGLTGGAYTDVFVDGQLNISVRHIGASAALARTVPLETLSRGTIEQIYLAMRLAVIDLLFPQGGMPLLLDDCFLAYDDDRLTQTLLWLAENYSGQVFLFTCQKRETALLRKEQIPFTNISL